MKTKILLLIAFFGICLASFAQNQNPNFTISNATAIEGAPLVFTITLNSVCATATTISVWTTSGPLNTASSSIDFIPIQVTLTIPANVTTTTFAISTIQDNISEPTESFTINASIVSGCFASPNDVNVGVGTIIDDDFLPTFTISNVTVQEGAQATFTITLSNPSSTDVMISVTTLTVVGTATNADFTPILTPITIAIPAGALTSSTISIPTLVDNLLEGNETFELCGNVTSGNTVNTNQCGTCTIIDPISESVLLSIQGTYVDFNNDGYTNVGDVINYVYTVTNTGTEILSTINVFQNQAALPGGPIATLAVGAVNNTTYSTTHVITQAEINAGFVWEGAYVTANYNGQQVANDAGLQTPLSISDGIKLNLFFDTNANGIQDSGEQNYLGGVFNYQINSGTNHSTSSYSGMVTLYENNPANSYNISCSLSSNNNYCNGQYTLSTSSYNNITVANGSGIATYNFPIISVPCTDLSILVYANSAPPRPGFVYSNAVFYKNNGNQIISSGTITFTKDNAVSIVSTTPVTTATASGFTYNFTNLMPNEQRIIYVYMQVPVIPTVSLGQLVTNSVSATIPLNDNNISNNSASLTQTIVGSWDPNDKAESHGGKIVHSTFSSSDYLTYTIQFENTGTADAINIRVNDVLDNLLDENSIRMINATHPYVLERVGSTLNWKFNGVNLPPSVANTTIGKGSIVFQVKPKAGYSVGDIIPNTANIYFDFNPAIVTNTVNTEFVSTLNVNNFDTNTVSIYPNPVKNILNLNNSTKINTVLITSILGQTVLIQNVNDFQTNIDMSQFEKGIYLIKVNVEGNIKTMKIIKE